MKKNLRQSPLLLSVLISLSVSLIAFSASAAEKNFILSYSPTGLFHKLVRDRIKVVYERAGLEAEFIPLPHNRSLLSAHDGAVDGDVGRVPSVEEKYPNLRRVNVKLMDLNGGVYTTRKDIKAYNGDLLTNKKVGYVLGVRWVQKRMKGLEATKARDYPALFEMLIQGRIDIALATEASADAVMRELGDRAANIRKLQPFVFTAPIYHYVNKKNEAIIPRLEKALSELIKEGYWDTSKEKTYIFYTGVKSPLKEILEMRLQEAFRRIGKKSHLQSTGSAQRALLLANETGDGDAIRVPSIKKMAPGATSNLLQIPESIIDTTFNVYTKGKVFPLDGWQSLKNYQNGFRGGVKILEKNIPANRTILPDSERLFQMLNQGRLDTVTEHSVIADYLITKLHLTGIKKLSPPLFSVPGYSFIHVKHRSLIPEISQVLSEMKTDGSFEQIKDEVLTQLLAQ
ncbi:MAG: transporter substrate-binding domain-containing protein [Thermodesulfobacteriota bacterium]